MKYLNKNQNNFSEDDQINLNNYILAQNLQEVLNLNVTEEKEFESIIRDFTSVIMQKQKLKMSKLSQESPKKER